jgi:hypothetical protein
MSRFAKANYLKNTPGEQVYFDLLFIDDYNSLFGSTYIIPTHYGYTTEDHTPRLSHDCGSCGEINYVIDLMIDDLKRLRLRAKKHFADLEVSKAVQ